MSVKITDVFSGIITTSGLLNWNNIIIIIMRKSKIN